jgi:hypothetical protein
VGAAMNRQDKLLNAYKLLAIAAQAYWEDYYVNHGPDENVTYKLHCELENCLHLVNSIKASQFEYQVVEFTDEAAYVPPRPQWTIHRVYGNGDVLKTTSFFSNKPDAERACANLNEIFND